MSKLLSYHSDETIKDKYASRMRQHIAANELIRGVGWNGEKGCAVGCTLENYDHEQYPIELGVPEWLARLEDILFEHLSEEDAKTFPLELLEAIPVGVNLEPVKWQFAIALLDENAERVKSLAITNKLKAQVLAAIAQCRAVNTDAIKTGEWDESAAKSAAWSARSVAESAARSSARWAAWSSAESAAWSAAWSARWAARSAAWSAAKSAAWSAAKSSARWAAWSSARSVESAAWSAAWSMAESAARSSARLEAYARYKDFLIQLLREAK